MNMDREEKMWKAMYETLQRENSENECERQRRIQQVDGGFFERFGSLLREHSVHAKEQEQEEQQRVAEEAADLNSSLAVEEVITIATRSFSLTASEASNELVSDEQNDLNASVDSEIEETRDPCDYFAVGMNIDELYSELLYEILHNVGCDVSIDVSQNALFSYVQDAFKMSNEKHNELLTAVEQKDAPEILLNVEVIEAKELVALDSNGLSDPFVTLYLSSNSSRRYNTSVKTETLNPLWEEHFALPIQDQLIEDYLCLEVWDFDPAETVREKFGKIFQVKGLRGARKLLKEIAVTAAMGQHENELIGTVQIPLKSIPSSGMTMWYGLEKKGKSTRRGIVKLCLAFGSEKDSSVASQEHKHLLRILLLHELESSQFGPYTWSGVFSPQADAIRTQHQIQSGLSQTQIDLAQWCVYTSLHKDNPLNYSVYSQVLEKLMKPIQNLTLDEDDIKTFWDSTRKLLPACFATIRKLRKRSLKDKNVIQHLIEVLKIINQLQLLEPPEDVDLFPTSLYPWLDSTESAQSYDFGTALNGAIAKGAIDWFRYVIDNNMKQDRSPEETLLFLNKIVHLVRSDLQMAVEFYDKIFQEFVSVQYAKILYVLLQKQLSELAESEIVLVCKSLKQISYEWNCVSKNAIEEPLSLGTKLFELYLALQRFVVLGKGLSPVEFESFHIKNFHRWFHGGVAQWLDIAVFKALQRIEKAVELDNLSPVDESVQYSSSALDTLTIFHQIKIFWEQLNWPDVEGAYTFVAKIIDDICRCCVFYADKMDLKVDGVGEVQDAYETKFEVTREWCLAINNIDYVCQSLIPFNEELKLEEILRELSDIRGPIEAQRCRQTLNAVIDNALDTVKNKILESLEIVAIKMVPAMKKLLIEGAELLHQDSNSIDKVMRYLDNNLATLHEELNEDNFNRILDIIWDHLGNILTELIQSNIEKRRPPSFFANLKETLQIMVKSFKHSEDDALSCSDLRRVERLLEVNGMETSQLIHHVHIERWLEQKDLQTSPYGELTVRLQFQNHDLKIEIINARNLIAMDSNGSCDSFVRIYLLPEEEFTNVPNPKTQTHNKNQFPLYDELFTLHLSPEQKKNNDALVLFSIKDKDFLGMSNQLIGEAFVKFNEIPDTSNHISSLPQVRLFIHRPTQLGTDAVKALENRQGDKLAKEFMKKIKQKASNSG